jgi:hypothetical protein
VSKSGLGTQNLPEVPGFDGPRAKSRLFAIRFDDVKKRRKSSDDVKKSRKRMS